MKGQIFAQVHNLTDMINNGNWTDWSAIWSEILRVISKSNETKYDFRPKLHDTKFNYQLFISILK